MATLVYTIVVITSFYIMILGRWCYWRMGIIYRISPEDSKMFPWGDKAMSEDSKFVVIGKDTALLKSTFIVLEKWADETDP